VRRFWELGRGVGVGKGGREFVGLCEAGARPAGNLGGRVRLCEVKSRCFGLRWSKDSVRSRLGIELQVQCVYSSMRPPSGVYVITQKSSIW
jgi:hypothetical protein